MRRRWRDRRGPRCRRRFLLAYRRDETVTTPDNGGDVTIVALAIAKGATQCADLDLQIGFVDERCWPNLGDQLFLADQLTSAFDQSGQDVEGAAAKPHWLVALEQEPLSHEELVRAERDVHGAAPG